VATRLKRNCLTYSRNSNTHFNIAYFCEVWANNADRAMSEVIVKQNWTISPEYADKVLVEARILTGVRTSNPALYQPMNRYAVRVLAEAVTNRWDDYEIVEQATKVLKQQDEIALSQLAAIWKNDPNEALLDIMEHRKFLPTKPAETRLVMVLRLNRLTDVKFDEPKFVPILEWILENEDEETPVYKRACKLFKNLKKPASQQALIAAALECKIPPLLNIAAEAGYLPNDPTQKVLFYFLTKQWEKYETLDFDYRTLKFIYHTSQSDVQYAIASNIRESGRVEYLEILAPSSPDASWSAAEASVHLDVLEKRKRWQKIFDLLFDLPLSASIDALHCLKRAKWQPAQAAERELFQRLCELSPLQSQSKLEQLPPAIVRATARVTNKITDIAFAPDNKRLAIATNDRKVALWNMVEGRVEQVIRGFDRQVGKLLFLPDGKLVCAERPSDKKQPGYLKVWDGETLRKLGGHAAPIHVLEALDANTVLSGGLEGTVKIWDIAKGVCQKEQEITDAAMYSAVLQIRSGVLSGDKKRLALLGRAKGLQREIRIFELPEIKRVATIETSQKLLSAHSLSYDGRSIVIGHANGTREQQLQGQKYNYYWWDERNMRQLDTAIISLAHVPGTSFLFTGGENGTIEAREIIEALSELLKMPGDGKLTALKVSSDGNFMATGSGDAGFALWDLAALKVRPLFSQPLKDATPEQIGALLRLQAARPEMLAAMQTALDYLEAVLRYRTRFDVELADVATISAGEFDIEV
jgi:hypothetical protein